MILSNFRKSFLCGSKTTDTDKIPIPISGGTTSSNNIWLVTVNLANYNSNFLYMNSNGVNNYMNFANYLFKSTTRDKAGYFIGVGTGTSSESASDYTLTGIDTNGGLTHKYGYVKYTNDEIPIWVESVYENETSNDIVIKEMGLIAKHCSDNGQSAVGGWTGQNYMIARKVLSSPVTIHPNEIYKFIYKLDF